MDIVTRLSARRPRDRSLISGGENIFSHVFQTEFREHPAFSCPFNGITGMRGPSSELKQPQSEPGHKVKNTWMYISTPNHVL